MHQKTSDRWERNWDEEIVREFVPSGYDPGESALTLGDYIGEGFGGKFVQEPAM